MKKAVYIVFGIAVLIVGFLFLSSRQPIQRIGETQGEENTEKAWQEAPSETTTEPEEIQNTENTRNDVDGFYGRLHVASGKLVDASGKNVQLRGISTHGISWFPQYVNEEAVKTLREDWNCNLLRLAMYTAETGGYCVNDEVGMRTLEETLDKGIALAKKYNMYVIVDWHTLSDANPNTYVSRAEVFFKELSAKYKDCDNIIYEICNEPNSGTTWESISNYANRIIPIIRENDKNAVILVGTPTWCQDVDVAVEAPLTVDSNVMYTLHFYAGTHKESLREKAQKAIDKGIPIFVSEFGICDASGNGNCDIASADAWMEFMNKNQLSYCQWNLSNKNESSALINAGCSKAGGWTEADLSESGKWMLKYK